MWYLNLNELSTLVENTTLLSRNRFNYYNFKDSDHLQQEVNSDSVEDHIKAFVRTNGENTKVTTIMLLTNLATLGYQFNPVSFYFCFDNKNQPICAIAEVGNTYRELKPFFIGKEHFHEGAFRYKTKKLFYISPFIDHDVDIDFVLPLPSEKLNIKIDDYKGENRFFSATLQGAQAVLSNKNVLLSAIQFPLVTLKIIALIHYQALLLWLKKVRYHKKKDYPELQLGVYKKFNAKE